MLLDPLSRVLLNVLQAHGGAVLLGDVVQDVDATVGGVVAELAELLARLLGLVLVVGFLRGEGGLAETALKLRYDGGFGGWQAGGKRS